MIEASVCEKEVARKAFETEVREKHSGPAMIENVVGNVFKTRIYPVPAKGKRKVKITYREELNFESNGKIAKYTFPLSVFQPLQYFSINIIVDTNCSIPFIEPTQELPFLEFSKDRKIGIYFFSLYYENFSYFI